MKKLLKFIGGLVLLLVLLLVAAHLLFGRDIPPPDLSDLEPGRIVVADEDNAYTYFIATTNVVYMPEGAKTLFSEFQRGKEVDMAFLAEILAKNEELFTGIRLGLQCEKCVHPCLSFSAYDPSISHWLNAGVLLAAKTKLERTSGEVSNAVESCATHLDFADRIGAYPGSLVCYLVGLVLRSGALLQARNLIRDGNATPENLERMAVLLGGLQPLAPSFVRALKTELGFLDEVLSKLHPGTYPQNLMHAVGDENEPAGRIGFFFLPSVVFKPNKTREMYGDILRGMIADADRVFENMESFAFMQRMDERLSRWRHFPFLENGSGIRLLVILRPSTDLLEVKCLSESDLSATRILVACQRYRLREGRFPIKLEALVPDFLPGVPADPFDGKPFRYDPVREIVWSVGKDLKDSGGSSNVAGKPSTDRRRAEDAVYRLTGDADL